MKSHHLLLALLALAPRAYAAEDCANGIEDDTGGADCADPACAADPFCTDLCGTSLTFATGRHTAELLTGFVHASGGLEAQGTGALKVDLVVPLERPEARLELVLRKEGADPLHVCLDLACTQPLLTVNGASGSITHTAGGFYDGTFDHVFVDLTSKRGSTLAVFVVVPTVATGNPLTRLEALRLSSDVDRDGFFDGAAASCDRCWDVDNDGAARADSPGLCGVADCDDTTSARAPGLTELCSGGIDEDCDLLVDGLDVGSCGIEDCANGADDNGDGSIDCADQTCASDPACSPCLPKLTFATGTNGAVASDNDPDGNTQTQVFRQGASAAHAGAIGFSTALTGTVSSHGGGRITAAIARTFPVPSGLPAPTLRLRYALDGDAQAGKDVVLVCFDVKASNCTTSVTGAATWTSDVNTGVGIVTVEVPLPTSAIGAVNVVVAYDTVDGGGNGNRGLFVDELSVGSDLDGDGLGEDPAIVGCDLCVDADDDGYAPASVAAVFASGCTSVAADCDDDSVVANPGATELCDLVGDQDCDGLADAEEPSCSSCGNGAVTAGETCDDGGIAPGDGCSATCRLETGALVVTELHLTRFDPTALGEQWLELYNATSAPIDLAASGITLGLDVSVPLRDCTVLTTSVVAPGGRHVVALGPQNTLDGLDADLACGSGTLGGLVAVSAENDSLDTVDLAALGCELAGATKPGVGRSLITAATVHTGNDAASAWCLASTASSYANSGRHHGSPGSGGGCGEVVCDGIDDDCDGTIDQGFPDADTDGTCDARDCAPLVKSCTNDCTTDVDLDSTPDCRDGCIDGDGDGWGTPGGLLPATCKTQGGTPRTDCDDTLTIVSPEATEGGASCTNGLDDDCDGKADCSDSACGLTAACAGESCAAPTPLACGATVVVEPESNDATCSPGVDSVFVFNSTFDGNVILEVQNLGRLQYNAFLHKTSCNAACPAGIAPIGSTCAAAGSGTVPVTPGTPLFITLDNVSACAGSGSGAARLTLRCSEACSGGVDDDADGKTDCADDDCVASVSCANVDFDGDGRANGVELICGRDPVNPGSVPSADDVAEADTDTLLNCVDNDDDNDGHSDSTEASQCQLSAGAKNDSDVYPGAPLQCAIAAVDADCDGFFDSESAECGFIEQQCGDNLDNDGDQKADCQDLDCVLLPICGLADFDSDGASNRTEQQCNTKPTQASSVPSDAAASDQDNDTLAACIDTDDDGDQSDDTEELLCGSDPADATSTPPDLDNDGQCDAFDDDDDADGFPDLVEVDCGSDPEDAGSRPDQPAYDLDDDDICDARDADRDGDDWTDAEENTCGTSLANASESPSSAGLDVDDDHLCDAVDEDDDGDDWSDAEELLCETNRQDAADSPADTDDDGICDLIDSDPDGDLWPDVLETQCGTSALIPADNPTALGADVDGDILCDKLDSDDDGDGWSDVLEVQCGTSPALKASAPTDTDGDKTCDPSDDDDDGDVSLDATEALCGTDPLSAESTPVDTDNDGLCDARDPDADPDGDGWSSYKEEACGTKPHDDSSTPTDADADGVCDALTVDDDGDGWPDAVEVSCGTAPELASSTPVDTDKDGQCNGVDTDDDADAAPDTAELTCGTDPLDAKNHPTTLDLVDADGDDAPGCVDEDDDNDGLPDVAEALQGSNPLVTDSDGDGLTDGEEDSDLDGTRDPNETSPVLPDTDGDGLSDRVETLSCYLGDGAATACQESSPTKPDSDEDGVPDGLEDKNGDGKTDDSETNPLKLDTDADGHSDGYELGCATDPLAAESVPVDKDASDVCDGAEVDSDADGIADGVELLCGTKPLDKKSVPELGTLVDTDGDGDLDCSDEDDDDDGTPDVFELACGTGPLDAAAKPPEGATADTDGDGTLDCADSDDDGDGLSDTGEQTLGTDALDADSDDDGLLDGYEAGITGTSPNAADSDGDGVQDGTELGVTESGPFTGPSFQVDADPATTTDPRSDDTDNDGLTDGLEDANANGKVDAGESDPNVAADGKKDTDGDGLADVVEESLCEEGVCLDPTNPDTDGDGVNDKLEKDVHGTSPFAADTDGGGVNDGFELSNGTDPKDAVDDFSKATVTGNNVFRCDGGPGSPGGAGVFLLVLLGLLVSRHARRGALLALVGLLGLASSLPGTANAQTAGNMNIENFYPAGGRYRVFSVEQSVVTPAWQPFGHLRFHGELDTLRVQTGSAEQVLVEMQTVADLGIGLGLGDWAQLEVALPFIASVSSGDDVSAIAPIEGAGLGDLVVRVRGTFLPNRVGGVGVGMSVGATIPTGDGTRFRGDPGVGVLANFLLDHRSERVDVALNVGVRIRTEEAEFLGRTFGNELTYGVGVDVSLLRRRIDMGVELFGRTPLEEPFGDADHTTLELLGGPKWWMWQGLGLEAHVGAGLVQGYGAPSFRFGLGLSWAPAHEDADGDGVSDDTDACQFTAEDKDGWADDDGCPDLDDDNDNFADKDDRCPREPEDRNGIDDGDGCPDGDVDGDRIADAIDLCPYDREDVDLFEDRDGCPELDNDHDGILDTADACTEQAETINGFKDRDGCPDEAPPIVKRNVVQCRLQLARIGFDQAKDVLRPDSQAKLNRVAEAIASYVSNGDPPLLHVYVSGHASEEGTDVNNYDLSLRRALQVYDFLLDRGISASLLARRGFGEAKPLLDEEGDPALRDNRRVEFDVELGGPCAGAAVSTD